jgi:hypothetical protein
MIPKWFGVLPKHEPKRVPAAKRIRDTAARQEPARKLRALARIS